MRVRLPRFWPPRVWPWHRHLWHWHSWVEIERIGLVVTSCCACGKSKTRLSPGPPPGDGRPDA